MTESNIFRNVHRKIWRAHDEKGASYLHLVRKRFQPHQGRHRVARVSGPQSGPLRVLRHSHLEERRSP